MGCKTTENPLGTETTIWNKHNTDKNLNWPEANQLANNKHCQEEEQGSTKDKSSNELERELNSWPPDCNCSALTTQPLCFLFLKNCVYWPHIIAL